ncbi:MAG: Ig-like domain-containing protein [Bacteroidota bacterium]
MMDASHDLHVAYRDGTAGTSVTVKKFNGSAWVAHSTIAAGTLTSISAAATASGEMYISFLNNSPGGGVFVKKYNGSSWIDVGSSAAIGTPYGFDGGNQFIKMVIDAAGTPYVAYPDSVLSFKATVKKFDGTNWVPVGTAGFTPDTVRELNMAVGDDGTLYVAFRSANMIYVMKYNGTSWVGVGSAVHAGGRPTLAINKSGVPYVIFEYGTGWVMKYNGSAWEVVGTPSTEYPVSYLKHYPIAIDTNDNVFAGYWDGFAADAWKFTDSSWVSSGWGVGGLAWSMIVDKATNTIYSAYSGGHTGSSTLSVRKYSVAVLPITGTAFICSGATTTLANATTGGTWSSSNTSVATVGASTGIVTGISTGTTTISYTTSACSAAIIVTVNTLRSSITGLARLSIGGITTLSNTIAGGAWGVSGSHASVSGGGVVSGISAGSATISYTVTNGCGSNLVDTAVITVNDTGSCEAWRTAGIEGFSAGSVTYSMSMTIGNGGKPYVFYADDANGSKGTVMRYNGGNWLPAGPVSFTPGTITYASIAMDNTGNTPYVVYRDATNYNRATVKKLIGDNWVTVGKAGIGLGGTNLGNPVSHPTIVIDGNGTAYVAFEADKLHVMKYTGSWVLQGSTGSTGISAGGALFPSLAISSDGQPVVAYTDVANSFKATVLKYNGTSWTALGGAGVTAGQAPRVRLKIHPDGTPYIAYIEGSSYKVTVMKFNGSAWVYVGSAAFSPVTVNGELAFDISPAGVPYVSFSDFSAGIPGVTTMKFDGSSWVNVGGAKYSLGMPVEVRMAIDGSGLPYVCYGHQYADYKVVVKTLEPVSPPTAGAISGPATVVYGSTVTLSASVPHGVWSVKNFKLSHMGGGAFVGNGVGIDTVSYSVITSCGTAVATYTVAVTMPPISGPLTISGSGSVTLTHSISGGTWSSNCSGIATVGSSGVVTGVSNGLATITYTVSGGSTTSVVTVSMSSSAITGTLSMCAGAVTALGHPVSGGAWSSSTTAVATIAMDGTVTGVTAGTASITYAYGSGCSSITTVTVNAATTLTGPSDVEAGSYITLAANVSGGTWSSSSTAVGSVAGGVVFGLTAGTTTITYVASGTCGTAIKAVSVAPLTTVCKYWKELPFAGYWYSGFELDADGTPYVSTMGSSGKAEVRKYNGTSWVLVGSAGISDGAFGYSDIAIAKDGTIYLSYRDEANSNKLTVKKYNGSSWATAGTTGFSDRTVAFTKLVVDNSGSVQVAYYEYTSAVSGLDVSDDEAIRVKKFNGSTWNDVGSLTAVPAYLLGSSWASQYYSRFAFAIDGNGNLILAYPNMYGYIDVQKYNGTSWALIGSNIAGASGRALNMALDADNTPYISYNSAANVMVKKYTGGTWTTVGGTIAYGDFSSIGIDANGVPYVGYTTYDAGGGSSLLALGTVMVRFDGTSWIHMGTTTGDGDIRIDGSGTVYASGTGGGVIRLTKTTSAVPASTMPAICVGGQVAFSNPLGAGAWMSSNPAVGGTSYHQPDYMKGLSAGTTTMTYLNGTCTASYIVTVNATPVISPSTSLNVCVGSTIALTGSPAGGTWWTMSTSKISIGSTTGMVTGIASGIADIRYRAYGSDGCTVIVPVTVNATASAGSISGSSSVEQGESITLSSSVSGGTWSISNANATVGTGSGIVTGVTAGTSVITYSVTSAGCIGFSTYTVTVTLPPIEGTLTISGSGSVTLTHSISGGTWSTSCGAIATVTSGGVVTGVSNGLATISYTVDGDVVTAIVTVNMTSSAIAGSLTVCEGAISVFTHPVSGGAWSSSNTAVGVFGSTGGLSGVSVGTTTISYSYTSGCTSLAVATVNAATNAGTITGASTVNTGETITLANAVSGGIWSTGSSNATVGSTGMVTGVTAGTAIISYSVTGDCGTAVATKTVSVTSTEEAEEITGTMTVCAGSATTLSSATAGGTWASNNTAIATISSGGVVTGVVSGVVGITYTTSAGTATAVVTVSASPTVIGGTMGLCTGNTTTLNNVAGGGTWTSSNTSVATVGAANGAVTGASNGTATITYTLSSGCYATAEVSVNEVPSAITGTTGVCVSAATTLTTTATGGTWSSSNTAVATVSSTGEVTGVAGGMSTITYSLGTGCRATAAVTVYTLPAAISGTASVCEEFTTALGNTTAGGTWSSSNTSVATIGTSGTVTAVSTGNADIAYTVGTGCSRSITVTVNATPSAITGATGVCIGASTMLTSASTGGTWTVPAGSMTIGAATGIVNGLSVGTSIVTYTLPTGCKTTATMTVNSAPPSITGVQKVCPGTTTTLANSTTGGTWTTDNASLATVDAASGVVTGVTAGTVQMTYTTGTGCYRTALVTVNAAPAAIGGTPATCVGSTTTLTNATAGVSWTSSNTAVASINSTSGIATGIATGTSTITYTLASGCIATVVLSVNGIPAAIGGPANGCVGAPVTLTNSVGGGIWSTSNTAIATVAGPGNVTGVTPGYVTITYTTGTGCYKTKAMTINNPPAAITGYPIACIGLNTTLSSTGSGTWASSDVSVATMLSSTAGHVRGVSGGTATITFTASTGCARTSTVSVNAVPGASTGATALCIGNSATLSNASPGGSWSSSNANATVGGTTGIVNGLSMGAVNITYSFGTGCRTVKAMTVNQLPAMIGGTTNACLGLVTTLSDVTPGGTWSSSTPAVATVGTGATAAYGAVTGVSLGTSTISFTITSTGCVRTTTVTVNASPNAGTITGAIPLHTTAGGGATSVTLSSTGDAGGAWTSSNTARATVGAATGLVSAVSAGTATISYSVTLGACTARATQLISITSPRPGGAVAASAASNLQLYPNPTTGEFTVVADEAGTLQVYTIDGREVTQFVIASGINPLSLPKELAAGVYMCRYNSENGNTVMIRLVHGE